MPNLFTHVLIANQAAENATNDELRGVIETYKKIFQLGAQGPDLFYFYRAYPWSDNQGLYRLAELLHTQDTGHFFETFLKIILECEKNSSREVLISYLCGFLTHYSADATIHPYVMYRTGDITVDDTLDNPASRRHMKMETAIDAYFIRARLNQPPRILRKLRLVQISHRENALISGILSLILQKVYAEKVTPSQIFNAVLDTNTIHSLLVDERNPLVKIVKYLGVHVDPHEVVHSAVYPDHPLEEVIEDYLYLQRKSWCLPWDDSKIYNYSFLDLMDQAVQRARLYLDEVSKVVFDNGNINDAMTAIGNLSMVTGLNCTEHVELRFFDLIL